ncbi:SigE-dependent sporulation protein [Oceanobacillus piezotolerans]|uniref:SigE-dependent sporulation protein n=1 Tax=Oceanobacillus piezotolerans TaxID=2448030 RepID=A0A498DHN0_9BACI|nr:sporulation YhaL family protein [Oceanobacillus piezotolerans]RLL45005.1 SigE-dependent sporulation protein [Oceanobacillus piezotolerans]
MILGIPWWIIMVIGLIFFSGYMAFRTSIAERRLELQFIEREGRVYIKRMEEEKTRREEQRERIPN